MKRNLLFCMVLLLLITARAGAQDKGYNERARKYIADYSTLAILEQQRSGIPAAITLGQGILETEAGASELMTEANNHFGIKCKNGWLGPTYSHTDDAPDECFKKYTCAAESFSDHSALLKRNPRYSPLLVLPQTDYAAWAKCLKKCGYATNPQYAERLIKIIEDFKLQDYTLSAFDSSLMTSHVTAAAPVPARPADTVKKPYMANAPAIVTTKPDASPIKRMADSARNIISHPPNVVTPAPVKAMARVDSLKKAMPNTAIAVPKPEPAPAEESHIVIVNGLKAFYAYKDELLLQYAMKYHIGYPQLLSMNDLTDGPLPFNMYIYLEHKLTKGTNMQHVVREGESLLMTAQAEGMQVKSLRELNLLNPNEEPADGAILELQHTARQKPQVQTGQLSAHSQNAIILGSEQQAANTDYIAVNKIKASTYADTARPRIASVSPVEAMPAGNVLPATATASEDSAEDDEPVLPASQVQPVATAPPVQAISAGETMPQDANKAGAGDKAPKYYTVKKGDTAFSIAKRNNITLDQLAKWNDMDNNQVKTGQSLQVKE